MSPTRFGGRPDVVLALVLDCADLERSATFWCAVLGYEAEPASAGPYRSLLPPSGDGIELLLQRVPDKKLTKNRLHLDLRVPDLAAETSRVLSLGAELITPTPISEHGWTWNVLADPDNNEFCILQPPPENQH
ncbi:VOC family protein [Paractinoplanes brasiliensis]|uniref:Putative enzyme related to lactoylglutathione lyase n=1 Tax=Paractinoplanes brasiliensis TaxID=52695 RepID=A0A4R6JRT6_9ACTN|nr:VOC family protein [Actinoplanes brasiliensis]TDO39304.1 putative enzyme related to lactoylglutathione lyase [Actinoplanes brasiliensis]GID32678.1 glyoxalase [Actinoplanes brasiliensis]